MLSLNAKSDWETIVPYQSQHSFDQTKLLLPVDSWRNDLRSSINDLMEIDPRIPKGWLAVCKFVYSQVWKTGGKTTAYDDMAGHYCKDWVGQIARFLDRLGYIKIKNQRGSSVMLGQEHVFRIANRFYLSAFSKVEYVVKSLAIPAPAKPVRDRFHNALAAISAKLRRQQKADVKPPLAANAASKSSLIENQPAVSASVDDKSESAESLPVSSALLKTKLVRSIDRQRVVNLAYSATAAASAAIASTALVRADVSAARDISDRRRASDLAERRPSSGDGRPIDHSKPLRW